ncbi:MAG TPA: hypothetical protein VK897_28210 [Anaerolineales bacterium]|nr:hypothetical protein [Anaerolineales bacterium]
MRRSNAAFVFFLALGILVVLACGAVAGNEPPDTAGEPPGAQSTAPLPSELPTDAATEMAVPSPQPALPERRRLTLEFPPEMRAGDADVVRLMLEVDDLGNLTPTAEIGGNVVTGKVVEIPNLYESHHVVAEARFDIAGMEVRPAELVSEPLAPGNSATFYWSIRPQEVGTYRGTVWLYLRFVDKQNGDESRKPVSAQLVEIEAVNLLGLSGRVARTTGTVGSIVGAIIGFPFFEDIVKFLFKKRIKSK